MSEAARPGAGTRPRHSSVSIALVGSGGAGVMTAGNMLLEAAAHAGYYALMTRSSGPQIRGGEAAAMIRIARVPIDCMDDHFHVLAAVDWDNVHRFGAEIPLGPDSLIVGDPDQGEPHEVFTRSGAAQAKLPLKKMAKAIPEGRPNMLLLGFAAALAGLPDDSVSRAVREIARETSRRAARPASRQLQPGAKPLQPWNGNTCWPRRHRGASHRAGC